MKSLQNPDALTFEQAITELEGIVRQLEGGQVPLEDAIRSYERGNQLKHRCESLLNTARLKVEEVMASSDGKLALKSSTLSPQESNE